jgi:acylphosphatase
LSAGARFETRCGRGHRRQFSHDSIDAATRSGVGSRGEFFLSPSPVLYVAGLIESRVCGLWAVLAVHDTQQAKRYFVSGMVQGVGYRYFVERAAHRLGLAGTVRNLGDGRVEVYAIGTAEALEQLRTELERGPRGAQVSRVKEETAAFDREFTRGFSVERDG